MAMVTTKLDSKDATTATQDRRLIVTWQHPESRDILPIGVLSFGGADYRFDYLEQAKSVVGFKPLLGFPEYSRSYISDELFALFAQRVMDPGRPDFQRYVEDLGLDEELATPWEQLTRSGGTRQGDTLQLFPVPRMDSTGWSCFMLLHGMRYLLQKDVVVSGSTHHAYSPGAFEEVLDGLQPGDELVVEHEATNGSSKRALLATTTQKSPLGWVPNWFAGEVFELDQSGLLSFFVERVNPADAGWHMRLVAKMHADCSAEYDFFQGPNWALASA